MQNLNVKYNNDKSRDYTNPNLPTGDANLDAASLALGGELLPQLLMGAGSQPRARIPGEYGGYLRHRYRYRRFERLMSSALRPDLTYRRTNRILIGRVNAESRSRRAEQ